MSIKLRTLLWFAVLGAAAAAGFVHFGVYNIAADRQHTRPVFALLDYAMRKSVKQRSKSIAVPDLADARRVERGLALYRAYCLQCHGAPGVAPDPLAFGMTPVPANLAGTAREWPAAEMYWVIKHGIKMSGMPSWNYRLTDAQIWDVVAFVRQMTVMSPADYQALAGRVPAPAPAQAQPTTAAMPQNGDVQAGKRAVQQYLCATCHQIPGVVGANRHVGPPLNGIAKRKYIGGVVPNTPENMLRFVQNPQQSDPLSAMPNLGVHDKDARDIVAYLYTLEDLD